MTEVTSLLRMIMNLHRTAECIGAMILCYTKENWLV